MTNEEKPNLIFYEVLTGKLNSGYEIMVQIFRYPDGRISLAQFAFKPNLGATWGPPNRLTHMSTTPTNDGA